MTSRVTSNAVNSFVESSATCRTLGAIGSRCTSILPITFQRCSLRNNQLLRSHHVRVNAPSHRFAWISGAATDAASSVAVSARFSCCASGTHVVALRCCSPCATAAAIHLSSVLTWRHMRCRMLCSSWCCDINIVSLQHPDVTLPQPVTTGLLSARLKCARVAEHNGCSTTPPPSPVTRTTSPSLPKLFNPSLARLHSAATASSCHATRILHL